MKTTRFQSFMADMEDIGRKCNRAVRSGARSLAAMSWPSLLAIAVLLACLLTVVPLGRNKVSVAAILQAAISVAVLMVLAMWAGTALDDRQLGPPAGAIDGDGVSLPR